MTLLLTAHIFYNYIIIYIPSIIFHILYKSFIHVQIDIFMKFQFQIMYDVFQWDVLTKKYEENMRRNQVKTLKLLFLYGYLQVFCKIVRLYSTIHQTQLCGFRNLICVYKNTLYATLLCIMSPIT